MSGFGAPKKNLWKTLKDKYFEDDSTKKKGGLGTNMFDGLAFQLLSELRLKAKATPVNLSNVLFDLLVEDGTVSVNKFWHAIESTGLRQSDPRLKSCRVKLEELKPASAPPSAPSSSSSVNEPHFGHGDFRLNKADFTECVSSVTGLLGRAFKNDMVIPEFNTFATQLHTIFEKCRENTGGLPAQYIPTLARGDPNHWGVSVCTIDGQRCSFGDTLIPFCLQSCSKPLNYSVAISDRTAAEVHRYVGTEPSGRSFNKICLDKTMKPHNPMINAGAIMTTSLCKPGHDIDKRFEQLQHHYRRLAGHEFIGYDDETYESEKATADRNYALAYYMRENNGFPEGTDLMETCSLYFKLCSVEATAESASVIAATLANGGVCPITEERVLSTVAVKDSLSLMYSCGMYDYSGQFAFRVGLPAKSGVAGAILLVIPNVMGICAWSPPLDSMGNSVRGVQFCESLVDTFSFHNYDSLSHGDKIDPRKKTVHEQTQSTGLIELLYSVTKGDISAVSSYVLSGGDLAKADYNGRTALHQACAEGHLEIVILLVKKFRVPVHPKDRWGFTPLDEAEKFDRTEVADYLRNCSRKTSVLDLVRNATVEEEAPVLDSGRNASVEDDTVPNEEVPHNEVKDEVSANVSPVKSSAKERGKKSKKTGAIVEEQGEALHSGSQEQAPSEAKGQEANSAAANSDNTAL